MTVTVSRGSPLELACGMLNEAATAPTLMRYNGMAHFPSPAGVFALGQANNEAVRNMKPVDSPSPTGDQRRSGETPLPSSGALAGQVNLGPAMEQLIAELADGAPRRRALLMALGEIIEILDAERIFLFRLRKAGGFQVLTACDRDGVAFRSPERRMSHYAVKMSMSTGEEVLIRDARHDRRYRAEEVLEGKKSARSILVIPLRVRREVFGGIYADHRFDTLRRTDLHGDALRGWVSVVQLVLSLYERRHRDPAQQRRAPEDVAAKAPPRVAPSAFDHRAACRGRSLPDKWIDDAPEAQNFHGFLSANPDLRDAFEALERLSGADLPVLICGETGTGKSLLARAIHASSRRRDRAFLPVHCGSVPDSLIESELLGHVRGAFSGAELDRDGILLEADGGTVLLDEVGDMGAEFQKKLLRVLEDGVVRPIGAKESVRVDVRVISATCHPLASQVERGDFRRDLYFRIKGVVFEIAPIRERREDIVPLCRWFLSMHARSAGCEVPRLAREAWRCLVEYPWPGNVRELENEMRRLVALGLESVRREDLAGEIRGGADTTVERSLPTLEEAVSQAEREVVQAALRQAGGNRSRAALALRITRKSLYRRMKKYGLS